MRRLGAVMVLAVGVAAAACGSPQPRGRCDADAQCGAGHYCAAGGVCWPDAAAPVIDSVTVICPAPCLRDSPVTVTVAAHDDGRLASVVASLDLAPARAVPLPPAGNGWRAVLKLGDWPFPAFERTVEVTVTATDAAGNAVTSSRPVGPVTRLRWVVEVAPGALPVPVPGAVAVDDQGTAIFGASDARVRYFGLNGAAARDPAQVGAGALTAPVVVGSGGTWVPSDDGKVYRVPVDPLAAVEMVCDTHAAVRGVALLGTGAPVATSASGRFFSSQAGVCGNSALYSGDVLFQPVAAGTTFFGAEANSIHALTLDAYSLPVESWPSPASLGSPVSAPMAMNAGGDVLALTNPAAGGNTLFAVSPGGVATPLAATDAAADGPVVRAGGDVVVPEKGRTLSAWSSAGALRWRSAPLPGTPLTPLLLAGDDVLVVADGHGNLTALDGAGQLRWTVQLAPAATPLRTPNLHAPAGATQSTGYFPAADGKLHAVILDGRLDAAAPWPKAFHDPRNTGNLATAQPPP